jgi:signal peptidase I
MKTKSDIVRDSRAPGRETVESIVVAFTLALLFRAFEAEAFVIPTGSMAPTLMGRHKDLVCESCGLDYRVGSSAEEDEESQRLRSELVRLSNDPRNRGEIARLRSQLAKKLVPEGRCPNCGLVMPLTTGANAGVAYDPRYPSFNGDRILVDKCAYDFSEPARWDVVVFKYPEDAKTNYIKRLVGLPGETLFISRGDIWTSRDGGDPTITRKPAAKLRPMLRLVHDSAHIAPELVAAGWPTSWIDWQIGDGRGSWATSDDGRSFSVTCRPGGAATLRWRHLLPAPDVWQAIAAGRPVAAAAKPQFVGDLQPYNAGSLGPHWVGDLAVEFDLESRSAAGTVTIDLVKAGLPHRCTIDLANGRATLGRVPAAAGGVAAADPAAGVVRATAQTAVKGRGRWRLLFANVDDELSLFVGGRPVAFDAPTAWMRSLEEAIDTGPVGRGDTPGDPEPGDLAPVGITVVAADAAAEVTVSDLRVLRDVYYIATGTAAAMAGRAPEEDVLEFVLEPGEYFMLGDNSSASKDSRAWGTPDEPLHSVSRRLIIGRALVIFWPHGVPARWSVPVKIFGQEVRLPFWPNFRRMEFVR